MFCICGLRRLRIFSHGFILETLQDVKYGQARKWPPSFEENLSLYPANLHNLLTSHLTTLTKIEDRERQANKQIKPSFQSLDSTEVVPDFYQKFVMQDSIKSDTIPSDNVPVEEIKETDLHPYQEPGDQSMRRSHQTKGMPQYPLLNMGDQEEKYTSNFEKSQKFLQSVNIQTDELAFYPDVQEMSEEEIILCLARLKEIGIHFVFNLFLIRRISAEMHLEKTAKRAPVPHAKHWFKLRNGKYKLRSLQAVSHYLELCRLLERPELDLYGFVDDLASVKIYEHLNTIVSKIRQLRSIGATPEDVLSNLILLKGCNLFKTKVKVYKNLFRHSKPTFPVNLFLSATMTEFREKLQAGRNISFIASLLEVTPDDFLICWGSTPISTSSLVYKIHMCLKAGISKQDIFNSISIINRLSLKKSEVVMDSLTKSGHSISLCELKAMDDNVDPNGIDLSESEKDWTSEEERDSKEVDVVEPSAMKSNGDGKCVTAKKKSYVESSKIWRMEVFKLITHLLHLSPQGRQAMYKANISVDSTHIQDVGMNLDHLSVNLKFTREQIAACPLILAHPHSNLCRVTQEVEAMLDDHFEWVGVTPCFRQSNGKSSSSSSQPSSTSLASSAATVKVPPSSSGQAKRRRRAAHNKVSVDESRIFRHSTYAYLLTDPAMHLNVLQYFLEKEAGFRLTLTDTLALGK